MSRFVTALGSEHSGAPRINLDHVAIMRRVREDKTTVAFDCFSPSDEKMGRISAEDADVDENEKIIPDATKGRLIAFSLEADGKILVSDYPIIAWRYDAEEYVMPIGPINFSKTENVVTCVYVQPKSWIFYGDTEVNSREAAIEHARINLTR